MFSIAQQLPFERKFLGFFNVIFKYCVADIRIVRYQKLLPATQIIVLGLYLNIILTTLIIEFLQLGNATSIFLILDKNE